MFLTMAFGDEDAPIRDMTAPYNTQVPYTAGLETFRDQPFKTETETKTISSKTKTTTA